MKLRLTYAPVGGEPQEFEFDIDQGLNLEAEALEEAGLGGHWDSYAEWIRKVGTGNIRARRALLWILLRRNNPKIRFSDVVFQLDEFGLEVEDDEDELEGKGEPGDESTDSL